MTNTVYTVRIINHAIQHGNYEGTFPSQDAASLHARSLAARFRKFCDIQVCKGTPRNPGEPVGPVYRGEG